MHKSILWWLAVFILLCPVLGMAGCGQDKPLDLGNTPIDLPEHVGYALSTTPSGSYIAIIDLANHEIVGVHAVGRNREYAEDFAIAPNGNLFIPINSHGDTASNIIRVIDPATGKIVDEIEVSWGPRMINAVPGGKAIVEHNLLPYGEDTYACDVIDMNTNILVDTLYLDGLATEGLCSPGGKYFIGILDARGIYGGDTLVEFDPLTSSLVGDFVTLRSDAHLGLCAFVSNSKIYVALDSSAWDDPNRYTTIGVLEFPSGQFISDLKVTWAPNDIVVVGEKAYMTHSRDSKPLELRTLTIIDTTTDKVIKTLTVCPGPQDMAYSEATGELYVASALPAVSAIDLNRGEVIKTFLCDDERLTGWGFLRIKVVG